MSSNSGSNKKPTLSQQCAEYRAECIRLSTQLDQANRRIAQLEAAAAAGGAAAPKTKKPREKKAKTKTGRTINQVITHNLADGERVYRSVGARAEAREFVATIGYAADGSGAITYNVSPALQPMAWTGAAQYTSPSTFASACAKVFKGDDEPHHINGWNVCYVKRGGNKVFLRDLRVAGAAEPAAMLAIEDGDDSEDDDNTSLPSSLQASSGDDSEDEEDEDEDEEDVV